jgi:HK97 family phage portal protein
MRIPLISRLIERRNWDLKNQKLYSFYTGGPTHSGIILNEQSSMKVVAVYACVNLLASTLASLPLIVYRRLDRGKERADDLDIYDLLHDSPNSEQNSFIWRQDQMAHILLWGHCYSEIEANGSGDPVNLWPLPPWRVSMGRTEKDKSVFYRVLLSEGGTKDIPDYRMFHIQALMGLSPIRQAMEAVGLAQATQEFGARLFGQGANLGGVVTHPKVLSPEGHKKLEDSLNESYTGLGKSHRIMLLEEGMEWNKVGIPPEEAQFLETRKFQRGEIASLFRIPPHMIGDLEHATFSNIEHQAIEFVVHTLRPWLVNWEQELKTKLLPKDDLFAEFLVDGLLRGDTISRYQAYQLAKMNGWMNADDIRELENMNPLPNGEGQIYMVPLNMQPVSWLGGSAPEPKPSEAKVLANIIETRKGLTLTRFRMARAYQRVFENAAERIVDEEVKKLKRAVNQNLKQRSVDDFKNWLIDYYRDFGQFIIRQLTPVAQSLADAIVPLAKEQINSASEINSQKLVESYVNTYAVRHIDSSTGQINALLKEDKPEELLDERFDEWKQKRPNRIGSNETVQLANFVAKSMFAAGGVMSLVWRNTSGNSCPFCEEMDGKVIGIEQNFVGAGQKLDAEDKAPMTIYRPTSQPPLHDGCQCTIEPG